MNYMGASCLEANSSLGRRYSTATVLRDWRNLVRRNLDPGKQIGSWVALDHEPESEATALINAVANAYQAKGCVKA